MAQSREEGPSRIELVVLACLSQSKPPAEAEIGEALQQLALPAEPVDAARRRAVDLLATMERRGWATSDGDASRRKQPPGPPAWKLTDNGRRALRSAFGLARAPTWSQVRDKHFPALALGVDPGSEGAKKACTESAMTAAVLGARLAIRDVLTPMAVCDAVIADALGMPRGKLTLDRLRAHVLSRAITGQPKGAPSPEVRGYAGRLAAWIAGTAVGASGAGTKHRMARALARRWVCGEAQPLSAPVPGLGRGASPHLAVSQHGDATGSVAMRPASDGSPPTGSNAVDVPRNQVARAGSEAASAISSATKDAIGGVHFVGTKGAISGGHSAGTKDAPSSNPRSQGPRPPEVAPDPAGTHKPEAQGSTLLDVVRETIPRIGAEGRFGEKVYVSAIWRTIARDRKSGGISLDNFKRWLLGANRDGKLVLARADLIGAMDAKQVTESEINDRGATFHFVLDHRNGALASQRDHHAR